MKNKLRRRRKRGEVLFMPNSEYIAEATRDFIDRGGKITKIEFDDESYNRFFNSPVESDDNADTELMEF
jgi:hypothetical protein